jgi:hypothetical protein
VNNGDHTYHSIKAVWRINVSTRGSQENQIPSFAVRKKTPEEQLADQSGNRHKAERLTGDR